jgi:hypothetical protein
VVVEQVPAVVLLGVLLEDLEAEHQLEEQEKQVLLDKEMLAAMAEQQMVQLAAEVALAQ